MSALWFIFVVVKQNKYKLMGKDTNFIGQSIYVQLLNLVDREKNKKISSRGGYDRYVKKLDGYTHFVAFFLFAVLMRFDTLRETVIGMMAEANKLQHLGVDYLVKRSTLSDANNRRSSQFFRDIYKHLYNRYRHILSDSRLSEVQKHLYIIDSTTITPFSRVPVATQSTARRRAASRRTASSSTTSGPRISWTSPRQPHTTYAC